MWVKKKTQKMLALHMVLKPCARPPKQPMVLGGLAHRLKTIYGGDVVMLVPNNIKNKIKNIICGP